MDNVLSTYYKSITCDTLFLIFMGQDSKGDLLDRFHNGINMLAVGIGNVRETLSHIPYLHGGDKLKPISCPLTPLPGLKL